MYVKDLPQVYKEIIKAEFKADECYELIETNQKNYPFLIESPENGMDLLDFSYWHKTRVNSDFWEQLGKGKHPQITQEIIDLYPEIDFNNFHNGIPNKIPNQNGSRIYPKQFWKDEVNKPENNIEPDRFYLSVTNKIEREIVSIYLKSRYGETFNLKSNEFYVCCFEKTYEVNNDLYSLDKKEINKNLFNNIQLYVKLENQDHVYGIESYAKSNNLIQAGKVEFDKFDTYYANINYEYNQIIYCTAIQNSTVISFEDFKDYIMYLTNEKVNYIENKVMPEKWCVNGLYSSPKNNWGVKNLVQKKYNNNFAFLNDFYYFENDNKLRFSKNKPDNYTEISIDLFKKYLLDTTKKEKFVIPNKWYLNVSNLGSYALNKVNNWFLNKGNYEPKLNVHNRNYLCINNTTNKGSFIIAPVAGYKEITYEQFVNYIYNKIDKSVVNTKNVDTKQTNDIFSDYCVFIDDESYNLLFKYSTVIKMGLYARFKYNEFIGVSTNNEFYSNNDSSWDKVKILPFEDVKEYLSEIVKTIKSKYAKTILTDLKYSNIHEKYVDKWAKNILLDKEISITKVEHKELTEKLKGHTSINYIKLCPYKKGDLCWVYIKNNWCLRYCTGYILPDGTVKFYINQKYKTKYDFSTFSAHKHQLAKNVELPIVDEDIKPDDIKLENRI